MRRWLGTGLVAAVLALAPISTARALCLYRGQLYVRTTLAEEFADAALVLRVRVASVRNSWRDSERETFAGDPWTLYGLQVVEVFKGAPPRPLTVFTGRNSGGFYLERQGAEPAGEEYLLFLNPTPTDPATPPAARGSMSVNYSCGQSRRWAEVNAVARAELARLKAARRA